MFARAFFGAPFSIEVLFLGLSITMATISGLRVEISGLKAELIRKPDSLTSAIAIAAKVRQIDAGRQLKSGGGDETDDNVAHKMSNGNGYTHFLKLTLKDPKFGEGLEGKDRLRAARQAWSGLSVVDKQKLKEQSKTTEAAKPVAPKSAPRHRRSAKPVPPRHTAYTKFLKDKMNDPGCCKGLHQTSKFKRVAAEWSNLSEGDKAKLKDEFLKENPPATPAEKAPATRKKRKYVGPGCGSCRYSEGGCLRCNDEKKQRHQDRRATQCGTTDQEASEDIS